MALTVERLRPQCGEVLLTGLCRPAKEAVRD
jgi:hypothetical protein